MNLAGQLTGILVTFAASDQLPVAASVAQVSLIEQGQPLCEGPTNILAVANRGRVLNLGNSNLYKVDPFSLLIMWRTGEDGAENGKRFAAANPIPSQIIRFFRGRNTSLNIMEKQSPSKPRRAAKACSFCRRRKAGKSQSSECRGSKDENSSVVTTKDRAPTARHMHKNVHMYLDPRDRGRPSVIHLSTSIQLDSYTQLTNRRPTNARLSRLEAENEQLRQHLGRAHTRAEDQTDSTKSPSHQQQEIQPRPDIPNSQSGDRSQSAVSRIFISPNGDSSYHGLTSTLFDDAPTDQHGHPRSADPQVPVEHIRKQLMGEAAYQRELPITARH